MRTAALVFPHQLFIENPVTREQPEKVLLIEDTLFFADTHHPLRMHGQKLAYHKETMQMYSEQLSKNANVSVQAWTGPKPVLNETCQKLAEQGFKRVVVCDVHDDLLNRRLLKATSAAGLKLQIMPTPSFLNLPTENQQYRASKSRWFMADFYKWQRKRLGVLMDGNKPTGGKWSFDEDNRKRLPKKMLPNLPKLPSVLEQLQRSEAIASVRTHWPDHLGDISATCYPNNHQAAARWLDCFLEERFELFGSYEDAIVPDEQWLYHSVLTPMLNIGLLSPRQILDRTLEAAEAYNTPVNSVEGFIRQIIGWREFMRATYADIGVEMRTGNHWQHTNPMPECFYSATTGIEPVDNVIRRLLATGYCHHIERLMVLGGFMFLCEIEPDDIYRWFMEMFIDSYDWVMVPNVYAMSQNADGGNITTKPYFSGSNYILKMSHYKKGEWSVIWDALFWRWINRHKDELASNHRWSMMCKKANTMDSSIMNKHLMVADKYLARLHSQRVS